MVFLLPTTLLKQLKSNFFIIKGGSYAALTLREVLSPDSHLYLYDLDDSTLDFILELPYDELDKYVSALISRFYGDLSDKEPKDITELRHSYKASFATEKLYRVNPLINKNYTAIYTKTGLLRELVLDIYGIGPEKVVIN